MSTWSKIRNGWGLQEVPREYARELGCCWSCHELGAGTKLYTDQSLAVDGTVNGIQRMLERIRPRTFCKAHALLYFGD